MKIHPIAEMFPMMTEEELDELAADIKENGLLNPIVQDAEGTLIDGRNRLEACKRAEILPTFETLNGTDPVAYILAQNVKRRHLTQGQQAIAVAMACSESEQTVREISEQTRVKPTRIAQARIILEYARELAPQVLSGALGFDKAYETAVTNKKNSETETGKMERLRINAADLYNQVTEGTLGLTEAIGALQAREKEAEKLLEAKQQERELATIHLQKVLLFTRAHSVSPKEKADYWISLIDPRFIQDEIHAEHIVECAEVLKHLAKNWAKTYAKASQSKPETETQPSH